MLTLRYFYRKLRMKHQLKNMGFGRLFMPRKNKQPQSIDDSTVIDLRVEKLDLIKK